MRWLGLLLLCVGCSSLVGLDDADDAPADAANPGESSSGDAGASSGSSSSSSSSGAASGSSSGGSSGTSSTSSSSGGPLQCDEAVPVPCLDPAAPQVTEVPSEATFADALAAAHAGDVIQLRGAASYIPAHTQLKAGVTFRGCEGAQIQGPFVDFAGSTGTVEGFRAAAAIVARTTGEYTLRGNHFHDMTSDEGAAVALVTNSAGLAQHVTLHVEGNWFENVQTAIVARTRYDNAERTVVLDAKNNVLVGVAEAFVVDGAGVQNSIAATLGFNTVVGFTTGVSAYNAQGSLALQGNLFVDGTTGVSGPGPYTTAFDLADTVTTHYESGAPSSGDFLVGSAGFVDAAGHDFHLDVGSAAIDQVTAGYPDRDYAGCGRPHGPAADLGAYER